MMVGVRLEHLVTIEVAKATIHPQEHVLVLQLQEAILAQHSAYVEKTVLDLV
jgi:hypothetical protein